MLQHHLGTVLDFDQSPCLVECISSSCLCGIGGTYRYLYYRVTLFIRWMSQTAITISHGECWISSIKSKV